MEHAKKADALDIPALRRLRDDANIVGTVTARDGSVLDEAQRLIIFDSTHRDAAYIAALVNNADALLAACEAWSEGHRIAVGQAARAEAVEAKLAAAEAREAGLREALVHVRGYVAGEWEWPSGRTAVEAIDAALKEPL